MSPTATPAAPRIPARVLEIFNQLDKDGASEQAARIISCMATSYLQSLTRFCLKEQKRAHVDPANTLTVPAGAVRLLGVEIARRANTQDAMSTALPAVLPARAQRLSLMQLQSQEQKLQGELAKLQQKVGKHNEESKVFQEQWAAVPSPSAEMHATAERLAARMESLSRSLTSLKSGISVLRDEIARRS